MTDNENASISFEEVWKSLEEQDKTGVYERAREMAGIAREQLEYAFNHGYETAKAKYERPRSEWVDGRWQTAMECKNCGCPCQQYVKHFCANCGADMRGEE